MIVCDCEISRSYLLTFYRLPMNVKVMLIVVQSHREDWDFDLDSIPKTLYSMILLYSILQYKIYAKTIRLLMDVKC